MKEVDATWTNWECKHSLSKRIPTKRGLLISADSFFLRYFFSFYFCIESSLVIFVLLFSYFFILLLMWRHIFTLNTYGNRTPFGNSNCLVICSFFSLSFSFHFIWWWFKSIPIFVYTFIHIYISTSGYFHIQWTNIYENRLNYLEHVDYRRP